MEIKLNANALQEHIARRNLSQNGFALKAKVSSGYLAQLLAGKKRPSGRVREKLMIASGLEFDTLFGFVEKGVSEKREGEYATAAQNNAA